MGLYGYVPLELPRTDENYVYPFWSNILGWMIAASSCICIPVVAIYYLATAKGTFMEVILNF
jgi:hypothetical protein